MSDIWAFLLQSLTASGVAVLLLAVKSLFRDKLPPKWHFAIWGILGVVLLIPAGIGGRYVLFNWPLAVETLKTMIAGEYTFTRVRFPFPVLPAVMPQTRFDWLYAAYFLGVAFHLMKYAVSYIRLRSVLRRGWEVNADMKERITRIAAEHKVCIRKTVTVPGLPSAFVCGIFRPILALPADTEIDDKILLHELLHLKSRDTVWSIVICVLRSIHWCNPLLVYCAHRAGNDLEARCDQRVLELLEGEDRRNYGRMLLAMANDRFARTPGATCANNGGKSIRRRIESIARFKLYPAGMELAAVCTAIILALPVLLGVEATAVYELNHPTPAEVAFASARATPCTTPAGAFDAYGKAILDQNAVYRAMCAPAEMQKELAESVIERYENGGYPYWDTGLESWPDAQEGYYIYNLKQVSENAYEAMLVIGLDYRPDGKETEFGQMVLACQDLSVEKEGHRWVAIPLEEFRWMETDRGAIGWGIPDLPGHIYTGTAEDIQVNVTVQTVYGVDSTLREESDVSWLLGSANSYDTIPKPNTAFSWERYVHTASCTHQGSQAERDQIYQLGVSFAPVREGESRPYLQAANGNGGGSSSFGDCHQSVVLKPGWEPTVNMGGGGFSHIANPTDPDLPYYYAADLYINNEKAAELDLTPQEGGPK